MTALMVSAEDQAFVRNLPGYSQGSGAPSVGRAKRRWASMVRACATTSNPSGSSTKTNSVYLLLADASRREAS